MVSFFVFWGTLLFHIWPPSLYWPDQLLFWKEELELRRTINITRWTLRDCWYYWPLYFRRNDIDDWWLRKNIEDKMYEMFLFLLKIKILLSKFCQIKKRKLRRKELPSFLLKHWFKLSKFFLGMNPLQLHWYKYSQPTIWSSLERSCSLKQPSGCCCTSSSS